MATPQDLFLDSFQGWTTPGTGGGKWTSGSAEIDTTYYRTGSQSAKVGPAGALYKDWGGSVVNIGTGLYLHKTGGIFSDAYPYGVYFQLKLVRLDGSGNIIEYYYTGGNVFTHIPWNYATLFIANNNPNSFSVDGGAGIVEYPSTSLINYDSWMHLQTIHTLTVDGAYDFHMTCTSYLNEVSQGAITINYSMNSYQVNDGWIISSCYFTGVSLGLLYWGNCNNYYNDLYISTDSTSPLGDGQILILHPESDIDKEWTPSTGTDNFEMVNDTFPDNDSTYNHTTTLNAKDTFEIEDSGLDPGDEILGSQAVFYVRKEQPGDGTVSLDAVQGASRSQLIDVAPGQTYNAYHADTSALTTTVAEVDSIKLGYTKTL